MTKTERMQISSTSISSATGGNNAILPRKQYEMDSSMNAVRILRYFLRTIRKFFIKKIQYRTIQQNVKGSEEDAARDLLNILIHYTNAIFRL